MPSFPTGSGGGGQTPGRRRCHRRWCCGWRPPYPESRRKTPVPNTGMATGFADYKGGAPPWPSAAVALPRATTHVRSNGESSRYPRGAYHLQDSPARTAFVPDDLSESVEVVFVHHGSLSVAAGQVVEGGHATALVQLVASKASASSIWDSPRSSRNYRIVLFMGHLLTAQPVRHASAQAVPPMSGIRAAHDGRGRGVPWRSLEPPGPDSPVRLQRAGVPRREQCDLQGGRDLEDAPRRADYGIQALENGLTPSDLAECAGPAARQQRVA